MAYSTIKDIINELPDKTLAQLTDDKDGLVVDEDVVNSLIEAADAIIDGYCGTRYTVPLTPPTPFVSGLSRQITIYKLYARRREGMPELRKEQYDDAIGRLKDVASGKITLGAEYKLAQGPDSGDGVSFTAPPRVFTRDSLGGY